MPTDFAAGLPDKNTLGDLTTLPVDDIVTLVRQRHAADKAGLHEDLRIGTPSGMFSWAVPKFLPTLEKDKRLAIQQPMHRWSYNDFEGRLGHGYGKGTVSRIEKSPIVLLRSTPDRVMFTRGDTKDAPIYTMARTHGKNWLLKLKSKAQPKEILEYEKEHFKSVPISDAAKLVAVGASVTPKIDGAGALAYLGKHNIDVYGIRNLKSGEKPEYTDYIGNLHDVDVPKELQGTILRGELYGERNGKPIHVNQLSGILNSTLLNATTKRRSDGIKLILAALAVHKNKQDIYDQQQVNDIVKKLNNDAVVGVNSYKYDKADALIQDIINKKNPLTSEGVVLHLKDKRPVKAKALEDHDVVIRNIFKADSKDNKAGGFEYSLPDAEAIVGRVGTGFDQETLKDMIKNPEKYIGRKARINALEQYNTGAYRAPSFISMKED